MDHLWLKRKFEEHPEKTQRALAEALGGYDPAIINRMLKNDRQIKASEVPKIEAFFGESSAVPGAAPIYPQLDSAKAWDSKGEMIPVMGQAEGGPEGIIDWNGEVVDRLPRPPFLAGATKGYAVYVSGSSMEQRYFPGEVVYVHPGKPMIAGSFVVVQFRRDAQSGPAALVKQYIRRDAKQIILRQFNPEKEIRIPLEKIISVHRIVGSGDA